MDQKNLIESLITLKSRASQLRYNDTDELDDIMRKTKMILSKLFPLKFTYLSELDKIRYTPYAYASNISPSVSYKAWHDGQQELINLIDTRIEEAKIEFSSKPPLQPRVPYVEKIVKVEDTARIDKLLDENNRLKNGNSLWNRINWTTLLTTTFTIIGGAFVLGYHLGQAKFDKEKLDLSKENEELGKKIEKMVITNDSLKNQLYNVSDSIVSPNNK